MFGKWISRFCLLTALGFFLLFAQVYVYAPAKAMVYVDPTASVAWMAAGVEGGRQHVVVLNRGLYAEIIWDTYYDRPPVPFRAGQDVSEPAGYQGFFQYDVSAAGTVRVLHLHYWLAIGLLLIWPTIRWVQRRRARNLARLRGFPVTSGEPIPKPT